MKTVSRLEDMSPTGKLEILVQNDGDVALCITQTHDASLSELPEPIVAQVEFCTYAGGTRSNGILKPLYELVSEMERLNADDPSNGETIEL